MLLQPLDSVRYYRYCAGMIVRQLAWTHEGNVRSAVTGDISYHFIVGRNNNTVKTAAIQRRFN
jgi:hypothetical protein